MRQQRGERNEKDVGERGKRALGAGPAFTVR